jgi:hypothetical protein
VYINRCNKWKKNHKKKQQKVLSLSLSLLWVLTVSNPLRLMFLILFLLQFFFFLIFDFSIHYFFFITCLKNWFFVLLIHFFIFLLKLLFADLIVVPFFLQFEETPLNLIDSALHRFATAIKKVWFCYLYEYSAYLFGYYCGCCRFLFTRFCSNFKLASGYHSIVNYSLRNKLVVDFFVYLMWIVLSISIKIQSW